MEMFCIHRVDKKRDKLERKVLDSQERAFWDVHRPVVCWLQLYLWLKKIELNFFYMIHFQNMEQYGAG